MADKIRLNSGDVGSDYEPTDSEDEYSEEEQELLRNIRDSNKRDVSATQQVLAFDSADSDEEDDDDDGAEMHDSDIEGADAADEHAGLPDAMDWGDKSRNYYHTDFVDRDYDEYNEQEMEMAQQEEEEAKNIQQRLLKQMHEADFQLDTELLKAAEAKADALNDEATKIKTDISGLSKREQQRLFAEESPEFEGLTADFVPYMQEQRDIIIPVLDYVRANNVPMIPAFDFAQKHQQLVFTYCSNVAFYLLLKAKRIPIRGHPIIKRLLSMQLMLKQLSYKFENIIKPQFEALLERIEDGDEFEVLEVKPKTKKQKKSKLNILQEYEQNADTTAAEVPANDEAEHDMESTDNEEEAAPDEAAEDEEIEEGDNRRGITYQIAKNKGLTPHRKKELRNPRVKHRTKFRKALIRRKGAVRTVRKETKRYAGEISGIKATVRKGIKLNV